MKVQYKTAISDARWIAYDIPGRNVGSFGNASEVLLLLISKYVFFRMAQAAERIAFAAHANFVSDMPPCSSSNFS